MGPLARRWARERLEELLGSRAASAAVAAHALRYGLVSPHTSLVAIGEDVVVEGGVRRSVSVPVSVPDGMRWQAVKKQTTVGTSGKDETVGRDERRNAQKPSADRGGGDRGGDRGGDVATGDKVKVDPQPKPRPKPRPDPRPDGDRPAKVAGKKEDRAPVKKPAEAKPPATAVRPQPGGGASPPPLPPPPAPAPPADVADRNFEDEEYDAIDTIDTTGPGGTLGKAMAREADDDAEPGAAELVSISSAGRRGLRITAGIGGGALVTGGQTGGLIAPSARLEVGGRTLFGVGAALWLQTASAERGLDVQGQLLATFARRGVGLRWLEVGGGLGLQLGKELGPAASASLRLHLPPSPRAAAYLRYDGALLLDEGTRTGQNAVTLGLELGF
jgi:hypothetical protein